jgi:small subunit ribosomal protein S16
MKGFEVLPMVGAGIIRKNYKVVLMVVIRLARGGAKNVHSIKSL